MYKIKIGNKIHNVEMNKHSVSSGQINGEAFNLKRTNTDSEDFCLIVNEIVYRIQVLDVNKTEKKISLRVNGFYFETELSDETDEILKNMGLTSLHKTEKLEVRSPMPGLVSKILVEKGQSVRKGDILLILEAMKMENNIKAEKDGTISAIQCKEKSAVEKNEILIVFE
jgi:biotin carboxyl carrier protein